MDTVLQMAARDARMSLLTLGAGSVVAQVVLLREILATFGGSEIAAAVALGVWLVCTGLGSMGGARLDRTPADTAGQPHRVRRTLAAAHLALALGPFVMQASVRALPLVAGTRGSALSLSAALAGSLAIFLPYGLVSGAMVPALGRLSAGSRRTPGSGAGADRARWAYALDSAGCAAGGLLLSGALAAGVPHGIILALAAAAHLGMAARLAGVCVGPWPGPIGAGPKIRSRNRVLAQILLLAGLLSVLLSLGHGIDRATLRWRYPGQEVLLVRNTPFGQLAVTQTGAQRNILQDALPITATGDLSAEARVHPALCQVPVGARVLLLGGSIDGSLRATMEHRPLQVDCVETDAVIFRLGRAASGGSALFPEHALDGPGVRTHSGDGRAFVRRHRAVYDAILLSTKGPENAQLNRYCTEEFFREARAALRPGGVFAFLLPSSPNYLGAEQIALERSIANALVRSFTEVTILPGESHLYLAGAQPADLEIEPILETRGIVTQRLLDYDWAEFSDPFRRDELRRLLLGAGAPGNPELSGSPATGPEPGPAGSRRRSQELLNRDLVPVALRHYLDRHARLNAGGPAWFHAIVTISILAALLACAPARRSRSAGDVPPEILGAVMTGGFAAMALELAVLLLFQVIFGNLYLRLSLLVTLFLAGAAIGALLGPRLPGSARVQIRVADVAVAALALALVAIGAVGTGAWPLGGSDTGAAAAGRWLAGAALLPALSLLAAVPIGVQFAAAGRVSPGAASHLGRLYLADLAGAASGTLSAGLWLLPRGGIPAVLLAVCALKLASLAAQLVRSRDRAATPEPRRTR